MLPSPVQLIGSAITPVSWQQPAAAPSPGYGNVSPGVLGGLAGGGVLSALSRGAGGLNTPATAADIYQMQQGMGSGTLGNIRSSLAAASLANRFGVFGTHLDANGNTVNGNTSLGAGLGAASGLLGVYSGLQRGGITGYGGAAVGGLQAASGIESLLGNAGAAGTLGAAAGYIAAPLALYSAIKNWQSGNTKGDAIQGAEAGAAIGSIIPGVGTLLGAAVGGLVGAASSFLGPGKASVEHTNWNSMAQSLAGASDAQRAQAIGSMSPSQAFQSLAGAMSAHTNSPGHSEPIQQVFGTNGENNMMSQMAGTINSAIKKGTIKADASPQDIYNSVVAPWLKSKGAAIDPNRKASNGANEGKNLIDTVTALIGQYQSGALQNGSQVGIKGQKISLPAYGG
jgi:hypothetical protein